MSRVRVCFRCKTFVRIVETNPENLSLLHQFDATHSGHPLQVVNINELDESYHETVGTRQQAE